MSTPSEDQNQFNPSQQLGDLLFLVLDHALDSISEGGPLVPFVVSDVDGHTLNRFVAEPYEKSVAEAKASVTKLPSNSSLYALAYDGFITIDGKKYDAIIVHGAERGTGKAYMVAQRYSPSLNGTPLKPIGNPAFIGREDALFNSQL